LDAFCQTDFETSKTMSFDKLSRRNFLKKTTILTVGVAAGSLLTGLADTTNGSTGGGGVPAGCQTFTKPAPAGWTECWMTGCNNFPTMTVCGWNWGTINGVRVQVPVLLSCGAGTNTCQVLNPNF
jgi:hypothetical protein